MASLKVQLFSAREVLFERRSKSGLLRSPKTPHYLRIRSSWTNSRYLVDVDLFRQSTAKLRDRGYRSRKKDRRNCSMNYRAAPSLTSSPCPADTTNHEKEPEMGGLRDMVGPRHLAV